MEKFNSVHFSSLLLVALKQPRSAEFSCRLEEHAAAKPSRRLKNKPKHAFFPEAGKAASGSHTLLNNCPLMF